MGAPRTAADPVNGVAETIVSEGGVRERCTVTNNEEIHRVFKDYWAPIFQIAHDEQDALEAEGDEKVLVA